MTAKWKVENWQQQGKWAPKREQKWHAAKWTDQQSGRLRTGSNRASGSQKGVKIDMAQNGGISKMEG